MIKNIIFYDDTAVNIEAAKKTWHKCSIISAGYSIADAEKIR